MSKMFAIIALVLLCGGCGTMNARMADTGKPAQEEQLVSCEKPLATVAVGPAGIAAASPVSTPYMTISNPDATVVQAIRDSRCFSVVSEIPVGQMSQYRIAVSTEILTDSTKSMAAGVATSVAGFALDRLTFGVGTLLTSVGVSGIGAASEQTLKLNISLSSGSQEVWTASSSVSSVAMKVSSPYDAKVVGPASRQAVNKLVAYFREKTAQR